MRKPPWRWPDRQGVEGSVDIAHQDPVPPRGSGPARPGSSTADNGEPKPSTQSPSLTPTRDRPDEIAVVHDAGKGATEGNLKEEVRAVWDANASFWDERMGEGEAWHRLLIAPAVERLLSVRESERVLEVACGNGQLARRLATLGAIVTATDFSDVMLERARGRTADGLRVHYRPLDVTDEAALEALGRQRFDAAVCNMALMDIVDLVPLARALPNLLAPGGRFVFSVCHPCFNILGMRMLAEQVENEGEMVLTRGVLISRYLTPATGKGVAIVGQPIPQWFFNRPLSVLLQPFFQAGLVLDALEEPAFDARYQPGSDLGWRTLREIPPILVGRLQARG